MKSAYHTCPTCYRESLAEMPGTRGTYWQCSNEKCGQTFSSEELLTHGWDIKSCDASTAGVCRRLEERDVYRIPTTLAGQIYELRRLFRR